MSTSNWLTEQPSFIKFRGMYQTFEFQGLPQDNPPLRFAFLDCHPPVTDGVVARSPAYIVEVLEDGPGIYTAEDLLARGYHGVVISCPHAAAHYFSRGFAIGNFHYISLPGEDARITFRFDAPIHHQYEDLPPDSRDGGAEPDNSSSGSYPPLQVVT